MNAVAIGSQIWRAGAVIVVALVCAMLLYLAHGMVATRKVDATIRLGPRPASQP